MRSQILRSVAILGSLSLATANDVVSLFLPFMDPQDLVGEVIGSDGPKTTYAIFCPKGEDSTDCGVPPQGQTITQGDDTLEFTYAFDDYILSESCKFRSTTWLSCWASNSQSDTSIVTSIITSTTMTTDLTFLPVTITATSLAEPAATATGGAASATTTTTTAPSSTSSGSSKAEKTETPNAGVPQATGAAHWIFGGAGMALALAMA